MPIIMLSGTSPLVATTIDCVSRICRMTAFRGHEATFAPQTLARPDRILTRDGLDDVHP